MTTQAQRLASIRTRLVSFDYHEPVSVDSLELVERLFGDLVSTTEVALTSNNDHIISMISIIFSQVYQQLHEREEHLSQELGYAFSVLLWHYYNHFFWARPNFCSALLGRSRFDSSTVVSFAQGQRSIAPREQ
jgi:hypothetical protein